MDTFEWFLIGTFIVIGVTMLVFGMLFFFTDSSEDFTDEEVVKLSLLLALKNLL